MLSRTKIHRYHPHIFLTSQPLKSILIKKFFICNRKNFLATLKLAMQPCKNYSNFVFLWFISIRHKMIFSKFLATLTTNTLWQLLKPFRVILIIQVLLFSNIFNWNLLHTYHQLPLMHLQLLFLWLLSFELLFLTNQITLMLSAYLYQMESTLIELFFYIIIQRSISHVAHFISILSPWCRCQWIKLT